MFQWAFHVKNFVQALKSFKSFEFILHWIKINVNLAKNSEEKPI